MEEAVKAGFPTIGEIAGAPSVLNFTATRRLELFARANDVPCYLVRTGAEASLAGPSGARWRWRIDPHPSHPDPCDPKALGLSRWSLELVRARSRPPGRWLIEMQPGEAGWNAHRLRVAALLGGGDVETREKTRARATILPFPSRTAA